MDRMNDRGQYGSRHAGPFVGASATPTAEPSSPGFSWGGLAFFGLIGAGLIYLVRPH